jgi:hypothetical protein
MGARQPDRLGDYLLLLMAGCLLTRLVASAAPVISVDEAAKFLLDSPALALPPG